MAKSSQHAKELSKLGASKGGRARAKSLTPQERSEISRRAVEARWQRAGRSKGPPLKATYTGVLSIGDVEIPCAVLEDGTRLLTQYGYFQVLGRSGRPAGGRGSSVEKMAPFLALENLKPFITLELSDSTKPIMFQMPTGGRRAFGYRAETLPKVCEVYLKARDAKVLSKAQEKFAVACDLIIRGLADVGIIALVDEATGYQADRARDALAKILERFVEKELQQWVKTFPADFYREMFRLRGLTYDGSCRKPLWIGHLTNDLVYSRLAPGVLAELRRKNPVDDRGRRKSKHHQWLTRGVGHPKLLEHMAAVTALMKVNNDWNRFHAMLEKALPKYVEMPLWEDQGVLLE